jgi:hypothetical protein
VEGFAVVTVVVLPSFPGCSFAAGFAAVATGFAAAAAGFAAVAAGFVAGFVRLAAGFAALTESGAASGAVFGRVAGAHAQARRTATIGIRARPVISSLVGGLH